jgi:hypothetical protein
VAADRRQARTHCDLTAFARLTASVTVFASRGENLAPIKTPLAFVFGNLSVRLFNRRFTRLTLGYSKKLENLKHSVALLVAHFNFCRVHSAVGQTPAQACGLADHQWTIEELMQPVN